MSQLSLCSLAGFQEIPIHQANAFLRDWGHYLGACKRPFGRLAFGLLLAGEPVGVAVSASTVSATLAGGSLRRKDVVELARLCTKPGFQHLTRVTLRLWREIGPAVWESRYWPVRACVAYSDSTIHAGDIYRADGWKKHGTNPGSTGGGTWSSKRERTTPKTLWIWEAT